MHTSSNLQTIQVCNEELFLINLNYFIGGKPANHPDDPDFVPTKSLSGEQANVQKPKTNDDCDRFERVQNRRKQADDVQKQSKVGVSSDF